MRQKLEAGAGPPRAMTQTKRCELGFAGDGESVSSHMPKELHPQKAVILIGDTPSSPSVTRFLVPQLSLVSGPDSGTGQEHQRICAGLQISFLYQRENLHGHLCTSSSSPTGEQQPAKNVYFTF